jgi:CheY-like chemotaxis protein
MEPQHSWRWTTSEPFCAVVTDINLGDGPDGWAVAKHGRELNRELPVVYVTGANGHQWQSEGVPDSLLVKKPFTSAQILDAIRAVLQHAHAADNLDKAP